MMLRVYGQQYGLDYCITRACNVYGPGQQLWRLIPRLIYSVLAGKRFYLEGRGHSVRSFIHVADVCQAIYAVAHEGKTGEAYHIAPLLSHSILGIVEMICGMLDVKMSEVCSDAPERPGKDAAYKLNSNKLRALYWIDQIDLDDGIIDVIDWMKKNWAEVQRMPLEWKP
jgi:dTDP-glucose 4,6-dehydratase